MKKMRWTLTILILFTLLITACSSQDKDASTTMPKADKTLGCDNACQARRSVVGQGHFPPIHPTLPNDHS